MNNCFLMLSHLKIHVILFLDIVVVMLLCSMLEINDDVLYQLICLELVSSTSNLSSYNNYWTGAIIITIGQVLL